RPDVAGEGLMMAQGPWQMGGQVPGHVGAGAPNAANLFAAAMSHHGAGRLTEADRLYREALALDPTHVDSLHYLGVAAYQSGRPEVAVEFIGKAISLADHLASPHNNIGEALRALGRLDEAVMHLTRATELEPGFFQAQMNLGNALRQRGSLEE